jgi:hypothetical protein
VPSPKVAVACNDRDEAERGEPSQEPAS